MRELELYIDNDQRLYHQSLAIQKNLIRKIQRGRYDHRKAPRIWLYMVDEGARRYVKEFGGSVRDMFPLAGRKNLATRYANQFVRMLRSGEISANPRNATMTRVLAVRPISPSVPLWMR